MSNLIVFSLISELNVEISDAGDCHHRDRLYQQHPPLSYQHVVGGMLFRSFVMLKTWFISFSIRPNSEPSQSSLDSVYIIVSLRFWYPSSSAGATARAPWSVCLWSGTKKASSQGHPMHLPCQEVPSQVRLRFVFVIKQTFCCQVEEDRHCCQNHLPHRLCHLQPLLLDLLSLGGAQVLETGNKVKMSNRQQSVFVERKAGNSDLNQKKSISRTTKRQWICWSLLFKRMTISELISNWQPTETGKTLACCIENTWSKSKVKDNKDKNREDPTNQIKLISCSWSKHHHHLTCESQYFFFLTLKESKQLTSPSDHLTTKPRVCFIHNPSLEQIQGTGFVSYKYLVNKIFSMQAETFDG